MRYFIIIFIFIFSFGVASAGNNQNVSDWADSNYEKIGNYANQILNFVKQKTDSIPKEIENKAEGILEDTQKTVTKKAEQATEEIKQEIKSKIKSEARKMFWRIVENLKIKTLNPLKNEIQQGSDIIRDWVDQAKDFLLN